MKRWHWALLGIVFFSLGSIALMPVLTRKGGVFNLETLLEGNKNKNIVGDQPPTPPEPYKNINISAPNNSFGFKNGEIKVINNSFFWRFFENYSGWNLYYRNKASNPWLNYTQYLEFDRIRYTDYEKQNINFTAPATGYYRLNHTINTPINDYEFNATHHEYTLNASIPNSNETYNVFYNWSDIIQSGWNDYIIYNHGIDSNQFFYLDVEITSKISKNSFISLDPNFGNEVSGGTDWAQDYIVGTEFTLSEPGQITTISAYIDEGGGWKGSSAVACYDASDQSLVVGSATVPYGDTSDGWNTYDVADTTVQAGDYYLVFVGEAVSGKHCYVEYSATDATSAYDTTLIGSIWPDPWSETAEAGNYRACIYATYNQVTPIINNVYPNIGVFEIDDLEFCRANVDDPQDDTLTAYWYWQNQTTFNWHLLGRNDSIDTSGGALNIYQYETFTDNITLYNQEYNMSVNVTDGTYWGNETWDFDTFMMTPEIQLITPLNESTNIATTPQCAVTAWDNSSNPDTLTVKWFENTSMGTKRYTVNDLQAQGYRGETLTFLTFDDEAGESEFASGEYSDVEANDNDIISDTADAGSEEWQYYRFNYSIEENRDNINFLNITSLAIGYSAGPTSDDRLYLALFNRTADSWIAFRNITTAGSSDWHKIQFNLTDNITDFVDSNGYFEMGFYGGGWDMVGNSGYGGLKCNFSFVNITSYEVFTLVQTNNSVSSGSTVYYTYDNATESNTEYWWNLSVSNSQEINGTDEWYTFTTEAGVAPPWSNTLPSVELLQPAPNGTTNIGLLATHGVYINDTDGNTSSVAWWTNQSGSWVNETFYNNNVTANTTVNYTYAHHNTDNTIYYWRVDVSDAYDMVSKWYSFTTATNRTLQYVFSFNMSWRNTTVPQHVYSFNMSWKNTTTPVYVHSFNFSYKNTTTNQHIHSFNFSYKNTTTPQHTYSFNMSWKNTSIPQYAYSFNISWKNTTIPQHVYSFNFSYKNTTVNQYIHSFNMSWRNTTTPIYAYSFNISWRNTTENQYIHSFNMSWKNTTVNQYIHSFNMSFKNTTVDQHIHSFNFSWQNSSVDVPTHIFSFNFSYKNTTVNQYIHSFNMSWRNTTTPQYTHSFNMSWKNTSTPVHTYSFNMSWKNTSIPQYAYSFNISWKNTTIPQHVYSFNMSWKNTTTPVYSHSFNMSFKNTTVDQHIHSFNISWKNSSVAIPTYIHSFNMSWKNTTHNITITNPYPSNNAVNIPLNIIIYATFESAHGYQMNITWYYGNSSANTTNLFDNHTNRLNSTYYAPGYFVNATSTTYYWRVNVTDGQGHYLEEIFKFTTSIRATLETIIHIRDQATGYLPYLTLILLPIVFLFLRRKKRMGNNENNNSME